MFSEPAIATDSEDHDPLYLQSPVSDGSFIVAQKFPLHDDAPAQSELKSPSSAYSHYTMIGSPSSSSDSSALSSVPSSPDVHTPRSSISMSASTDCYAQPNSGSTYTNVVDGDATDQSSPSSDTTITTPPFLLGKHYQEREQCDSSLRTPTSPHAPSFSFPTSTSTFTTAITAPNQYLGEQQRQDGASLKAPPSPNSPSSSFTPNPGSQDPSSHSIRKVRSRQSSPSRNDFAEGSKSKTRPTHIYRQGSEASIIPIINASQKSTANKAAAAAAARIQPLRLSAAVIPPPKSASRRPWSPAIWILAYFFFNMGLTLYNKTVLVHFPYPYTLTALHTFCGTIGCAWARRTGYYAPAYLTGRQKITLALFSILYTLNIAVSNLSLRLVTIPFHQVVRGSAPMFTILVSWLLRAKSRRAGEGGGMIFGVEKNKLISLIPVVAGVGLATYGDYSFTLWGLILTLLGTFLAALKTVLTSILQSAPATSRESDTPLPTARSFSFSGGTFPPTPASRLAFHDAKYRKPSLSDIKVKPEPGRLEKVVQTFLSWIPLLSSSTKSEVLPRSSPPANPPASANYFTKRFDLDFGVGVNASSTTPSPDHVRQDDGRGMVHTMSMIKLHPLDLLARMSPLACAQCLVYAVLSGEAGKLYAHGLGGPEGGGRVGWNGGGLGLSLVVLGMNGVIAFMLNVVSLTANRMNGPLTMTVAANVKQVLTILLAMSVFHLPVGLTNSIGIALTLSGGAWYGSLEYRSKRERMRMTT
ncbi:UAA transporter [Tulasnella sp. JGI-2019a]|nr:UAA transporter [Tulasnella sp. JGI-2019a]